MACGGDERDVDEYTNDPTLLTAVLRLIPHAACTTFRDTPVSRGAVAVREFVDSTGRSWRAWDIVPDKLHTRTKDEDYLAQLYHTGWVVFETTAGDEKRRMYPIPDRWSELTDPDLEVLLRKAEVVPPRKLQADSSLKGADAARAMDRTSDIIEHAADKPGAAQEAARESTPDVTDLHVVRSFRYPGGRIWIACIIARPDDVGPPVLRFTAGSRHFDLEEWPKDWADHPDEDLVALLRLAAPRRTAPPPAPDAPRRRYTDYNGTAQPELR